MDYLKTNKASWDKRTETHVKSAFYDVEGFLKGKNSLQQIEVTDLGDVTGRDEEIS